MKVNIDEKEGKSSRSCCCQTTTRKTIVTTVVRTQSLLTYDAHAMLVLTANQNRATTSSSLKIEEVEDRPRWSSTGIEPGSLWLASQCLAY